MEAFCFCTCLLYIASQWNPAPYGIHSAHWLRSLSDRSRDKPLSLIPVFPHFCITNPRQVDFNFWSSVIHKEDIGHLAAQKQEAQLNSLRPFGSWDPHYDISWWLSASPLSSSPLALSVLALCCLRCLWNGDLSNLPTPWTLFLGNLILVSAAYVLLMLGCTASGLLSFYLA
jgi:hypothetical protein